jgi:predicted hotdog family 3-hydroxylacyl-ACP dehydratase
MLSALIRAAGSSGTVWVIRVRAQIAASIAALISIRPSARSLRMILGMRRLHALLPELRPRIHAPTAARPLRRSRLRAQQGREKQPHRERE